MNFQLLTILVSSNGWHTSRSDRRNHCTVDYYDAANNPMSREHVV